MRAVTVSYHDAVVDDELDASGFSGSGAAIYKLDLAEMERHFEAIAAVREDGPELVGDLARPGATPLFLAFDDGGSSAATMIAPLLERFGWRGHFFITAGRIGSDGFVDAEQIYDLRQRGHVIGSHSWSHPTRMSACGRKELLSEWRRSVAALSEILGEPVDVASVPGGYFSREVAEAAAESGIRFLFTSEPEKRVREVDGCFVLGRYALQRGMPAEVSAAFASDRLTWLQFKQTNHWKLKKLAKRLGGTWYLAVRERILGSRG